MEAGYVNQNYSPQQNNLPPKRVMIWAIPRSLSTVLCKCLSCIPGVRLFYEPYFAAWGLGPERCNHGMANEDLFEHYYALVQEDMRKAGSKALFPDTNWFDHEAWTFDTVKNQLKTSFDPNVRLVVSKDPAYAIAGNYDKIPDGYQHVFLIRHPLKTTVSFKKMMQQIADYNHNNDAGSSTNDVPPPRPVTLSSNFRYAEIYKLYKHIAKNHQETPLVIDADDLQNHSESILRQLFEGIGVPYKDSVATWPKSDEFSKSWATSKLNMYGSVVAGEEGYFATAFRSTHFQAAKDAPARESLTQDVLDVADSVMPMYEELYQLRIKP